MLWQYVLLFVVSRAVRRICAVKSLDCVCDEGIWFSSMNEPELAERSSRNRIYRVGIADGGPLSAPA